MTSVVHVTAPAPFGGLESVVSEISSGAVREGCQVGLIAVLEPESDVPAWISSVRRSNVHVDVVRVNARAYLRERTEVMARIAEQSPDVVHTHGYRSDVLIGPLARRSGFATVSTAHGIASVTWKDKVFAIMQQRAWRHFDAVVAVSTPLEALLRRRGLDAGRVVLIPNGLPAPRFDAMTRVEARTMLGLAPDAIVVGWVGRISHEKGLDIAIDALGQMTNRHAVLCVIGAGAALAACQQRAADLGVANRIVFAGAIERADRMFRAFDALLLSSRTEGTPMVLVEAAMLEVPIVAAAVGGVPDLLGMHAHLVDAGDGLGLAFGLDAIIDGPEEAGRRSAALKRRIEETVRQNDWVARYVSLYERLAVERKHRSR